MLDFRSDTVTLPTAEMLSKMATAKLGDDGRLTNNFKGEDPTVQLLENRASIITGKEDAILLPTGTMANHLAILSFCNRGDTILLDEKSHIFLNEKVIFDQNYFGMNSEFFKVTEHKKPNLKNIEQFINEQNIHLLCLENTHNFYGGISISENELSSISKISKKHNIPIHMDGARIFNASISQQVRIAELCQYTDTVSFCLSKGLGAPIGSVLCGTKKQMIKVRKLRKYFGGTMRQAGIIAATGIVALSGANINKLRKDHRNAKILAYELSKNEHILINPNHVETNIVNFQLKLKTISNEYLLKKLSHNGLLAKNIANEFIRLTTHYHIKKTDIYNAVSIINRTINEL